MKKTFLLLVSILILGHLSLKSQNSLVEYNNEVIYYYTLLDNNISLLYTKIFDEKVTVDDLKKQYNFCKKIVKYSGSTVNNLKSIPQDKYFLSSVKQFYNIVNSTLENEFKKIIEYYDQPWQDHFSEKITNLAETAAQKIIEGENKVIQSQQKFANDNDMKLE
ncbi:MAG: hypothetical protein N2Z72_04700 [Bacteroidales bacterium]|nr:hypothetical protein [Bacteroidales bacterium]